jgi:hypothetical protein
VDDSRVACVLDPGMAAMRAAQDRTFSRRARRGLGQQARETAERCQRKLRVVRARCQGAVVE